MVCRAAALHMQDSLVVWVGDASAPRLAGLALGWPAPGARDAGALGAPLLGGGAELAAADPLARRLAAALARPVYVCSGAAWERHAMPRLESALLAHVRGTPRDLS